ncbi:MAG: HU family DNA-binding protein [Candidatus Mcinerneyibacterium aminivorans]|uniref:HU family DNA-binding protein n=1 Tax=Candidatus Mcinerneyibacterium aminivorans TaxID=2703815 RepID=A0A5D0MH63_9BACT|nr:MAG: HU family DNA-binding protein [Candidatus Mcinerneyibacterium aminivorans]
MRKDDFITKIAEKNDMTKKKAKEVFDCIFEEIANVLDDDDKLTVRNFGTFKVSHRSARKGRNPQTGEEIQIPARKVAKFKASKSLKEYLN